MGEVTDASENMENFRKIPDSLQQQYEEACNYHRHYSALRFGMLGVYFAVIGAISSVALGIVKIDVNVNSEFLAGLLGFAISLVFWRFEFLCEKNRRHFGDSLRHLESQMGYTLLTSKEPTRLFNAGNTMGLLYLALFVAWPIASLYSLPEVRMALRDNLVDLAAVGGLIFTGIGLCLTAWQLYVSRRIAKGEFLLSLYGVVGDFNDIHEKLTGKGPWAGGKGGPDEEENSEKNWARVDRYMGLFETIEILIQDGILDLRTVDRQYGHRVAALVQNEQIHQRNLVKRSHRWLYFIKLWKCLQKEEYFRKAMEKPVEVREKE